MKQILMAAVLALAAGLSHAALSPEAKDHPLISRFAGSTIEYYQAVDFDEVVMPVKPIASQSKMTPDQLLKAEGKVTRIDYALPPNKTPVEVMRNYEQALGGAGFKTVFKCADAECGDDLDSFVGNSGKVLPSGWKARFGAIRYLLAKRSGAEGDVYALIAAMYESGNRNGVVYHQVVEVKPMQGGQVTVLDAAHLKQGLEAEGKVAVYGIYFDTAKAEIKPDSKPSLDEMAKLLSGNPSLKVYIVGHTDNAGTLASNLELSQRRADAVVKALAGYRIDAQRMVAKGVASLAPVASNAGEAGRAKNRRVELVVQ